jgi:hypothetical protein
MVTSLFWISIFKDKENCLVFKCSARKGFLGLRSNGKDFLGPRKKKGWTTLTDITDRKLIQILTFGFPLFLSLKTSMRWRWGKRRQNFLCKGDETKIYVFTLTGYVKLKFKPKTVKDLCIFNTKIILFRSRAVIGCTCTGTARVKIVSFVQLIAYSKAAKFQDSDKCAIGFVYKTESCNKIIFRKKKFVIYY